MNLAQKQSSPHRAASQGNISSPTAKPTMLGSIVACTLIFLAGTLRCAAQDKSQYNLINSTPDALMRPMDTILMDAIVSPFTVDAGHFQVAARLISYYYSSHQGVFPDGTTYDGSTSAYNWSPRFEAGLLNNLDLEVTPTYSVHTIHLTGTGSSGHYSISHSPSGFDSVQTAMKINLWGNDGGRTALGLLPYLTIPTTRNTDIPAGIDVPFAIRLPYGFLLKLDTGFSSMGDAGNVEFANGVSLDKRLGDKFTVFCSLSTFVTTKSNQEWWAYTGFGAAYSFTANLQVFGAMLLGISDAYDYHPYLGINWRY